MAWTAKPSSSQALPFSIVWEVHWTLVKSWHPCLSDSSQEKLSGGRKSRAKVRDCTAEIQSRWHWALATGFIRDASRFHETQG